jgi:hypothetical protein
MTLHVRIGEISHSNQPTNQPTNRLAATTSVYTHRCAGTADLTYYYTWDSGKFNTNYRPVMTCAAPFSHQHIVHIGSEIRRL